MTVDQDGTILQILTTAFAERATLANEPLALVQHAIQENEAAVSATGPELCGELVTVAAGLTRDMVLRPRICSVRSVHCSFALV